MNDAITPSSEPQQLMQQNLPHLRRKRSQLRAAAADSATLTSLKTYITYRCVSGSQCLAPVALNSALPQSLKQKRLTTTSAARRFPRGCPWHARTPVPPRDSRSQPRRLPVRPPEVGHLSYRRCGRDTHRRCWRSNCTGTDSPP